MRGLHRNLLLGSEFLGIAMAYLLNSVCFSTNERVMNSDWQADIVAGSGEKNFNENFDLSLKLPLAEDQFVSILRSRNLEFRIVDSRNGGVSEPRHRKDIEKSKFAKMYEIYGGVDKGVGKRFRAYVDSHGYVTYIENAFSYSSR